MLHCGSVDCRGRRDDSEFPVLHSRSKSATCRWYLYISVLIGSPWLSPSLWARRHTQPRITRAGRCPRSTWNTRDLAMISLDLNFNILTRDLSHYLENQVKVGLFGSGVGLSLVLGFSAAYTCYYLISVAKVIDINLRVWVFWGESSRYTACISHKSPCAVCGLSRRSILTARDWWWYSA